MARPLAPRLALTVGLGLFGALACGPGPSGDRAAYTAALADPGEVARCREIDEAGLRGECVAIAASELARRGDRAGAEAACEGLSHPTWQPECWFMVADALDAMGEDARTLCSRTGPFQQACIAHTLGREANRIFAEAAVGREGETAARLLRAFSPYLEPPAAARQARLFLARHLAARDPELPFSFATCGTAPPDLCRAAWIARVRLRVEGGAPALDCPDGTVSPEGLDLPPYAPEFEPQVRASLPELCR